jgi:phosphatidate cytidylyltransferase
MHLKRVFVAAFIVPFLFLYVMYLPQEFFFLLLTVFAAVAVSEFYSMYRVPPVLRAVGLICCLLILASGYMISAYLADVLFLSVMLIFGVRLFILKNPLSSMHDIAAPVVGMLYIPGLLIFQSKVREFGPEWIIFLYGVVWASDSLAYYVGKGIGKRRLYKEVSPNKTVAGAVGSVLGGIAGACIIKISVIPSLAMNAAVLIGAITGGVTIIGDLVASMFKRDAGVKDSGVLIPGHGGILDKIDGVLFSGPVLYWMLITTGVSGVHV